VAQAPPFNTAASLRFIIDAASGSQALDSFHEQQDAQRQHIDVAAHGSDAPGDGEARSRAASASSSRGATMPPWPDQAQALNDKPSPRCTLLL
jgi:hypothetical protein